MAQAASSYLGEQRRRSTRVEETSAVIIRGVDLLGQPFEERAAAQNLSLHGCRYASKHHLPKNTWITLEVPASESRSEAVCVRARIAWIHRPQTLRDLFQVGVELESGRNVWGLIPPPSDCSSDATIAAASTDLEKTVQSGQASAQSGREEVSLEVYLQMAVAHPSTNFTGAASPESVAREENPLVGQLSQEPLAESSRAMRAGSTSAGKTAPIPANEAPNGTEIQQQEGEEFHRKWIEKLEHGNVEMKKEIASALSQNVAAQLADFEGQLRGALMSEWKEQLSYGQMERSEWEAGIQALREEVHANSEASERRLAEKLREIRRELESAGLGTAEEVPATMRAQWNELLESSLDIAARRLNDRLISGSQELVQRAEQDVARKIAELQKESVLAAETARATLNELKVALQEELSKARIALDEIEQSAGRFSEYSRQLEAASQDSLNEMRQKLDSSTTRQCAELDRHAAQIEKTFGERAAQMLEQMSRESTGKGIERISQAVAAGLASAAKATEELAAREEQAEAILRIHRERLRQVSEQVQREAAANLASQLAVAQQEIATIQSQALTRWNQELTSEGEQAAQQASAALEKRIEQRLGEADAQLLGQTQRAIDSAQQQFHQGLVLIAGNVQDELREFEANQIVGARERLAVEAHEQLESAENEFAKAAEKAASKLSEVIGKSEEEALQRFSAASEAKIAEGRMRLVAAGENVLAGIQVQAQTSLEHFQEQLAVSAELAARRAGETLSHQFEAALERFQRQGDARLEHWSAKQESLSTQALVKQNAQLQEVSTSWVEMTLERLDSRSEERVDSVVRATENAIREACVDIFENMSQTMKRQSQGTLGIRPPEESVQTNPEHCASA